MNLTREQLGQLHNALDDAIAYRQPDGPCGDCQHAEGGLCADHVQDQMAAGGYARLRHHIAGLLYPEPRAERGDVEAA